MLHLNVHVSTHKIIVGYPWTLKVLHAALNLVQSSFPTRMLEIENLHQISYFVFFIQLARVGGLT